MSDRSPIPNLPPLSGVQDPAVRAYLEALSQAWLVRNGQTRNNDERFITAKDLTEGITTVVRNGGGGGTTIMGGGSLAETIANAIGSLAASIRESRLNKLLEERIARIEMPEWFKGKFGAEIQTEIAKEQNARSAMVAEVKTAVANVAGNVAIAQQTIKTTSSVVNATAELVTGLQAEVGDVRVNAEEALRVAANVEGDVTGSWTVKFDANGYVTGAGLGLEGKGGVYTSEFIVKADRFSIVGSTPYTDAFGQVYYEQPFIATATPTVIDGVTYPPGVWLSSAMIANASITNAMIGNELKSSNYVAGVSGWKLSKEGSPLAEFNGDVVINGRITNTSLNNAIKDNVVSGTVTLSLTTPSVTVNHSLGRLALVILGNTKYDYPWGGEGGGVVYDDAFISSNTPTGFTISAPNSSVSFSVQYTYI